MDSFEKDEERIRRLLQTCDVSSDEADDDDSGEEEDNLEARLDSTDTEQEMNDIDSEDELDTVDLESYISRIEKHFGRQAQSECKNSCPQHYNAANWCERLCQTC